MSLNPHIATKYWVEEGEFPTAKNFQHYDLSAHFREKQRLAEEAEKADRLSKYPMYNDMFVAVMSGKVSEVKRILELGGDLKSTDVVRTQAHGRAACLCHTWVHHDGGRRCRVHEGNTNLRCWHACD